MAGNPEEPLLLMKLQSPVTGLALDWIHKLLYWTSAESASLHVGLLDGSAQRPLVTGLDRPSAVAVDPLHRCHEDHSYWRVYSRNQVSQLMANSINLSVCFFFFFLFAFLRLLFWTECGSSARIVRCSLDGRDRKPLVTHLIRNPVALSLGTFLFSQPEVEE